MRQNLDQSERYRRPPQSDQLDNPEILYLNITDAEWIADEDIAKNFPNWGSHSEGHTILAIHGIECVGYAIVAGDVLIYIDYLPDYAGIRTELLNQVWLTS